MSCGDTPTHVKAPASVHDSPDASANTPRHEQRRVCGTEFQRSRRSCVHELVEPRLIDGQEVSHARQVAHGARASKMGRYRWVNECAGRCDSYP